MNKVTQVLGNHKSTYLAQCSSIFVFQKAKNQKTYFSANSKQKRAKYYIFKVFQISYFETKAFFVCTQNTDLKTASISLLCQTCTIIIL